MFTYDEHSGAGNTGWPGINSREGIQRQNEEYVEELKAAQREERDLLSQFARVMATPDGPQSSGERSIVVFNPSAWERTDVVCLSAQSGSHISRIIDKRWGKAVEFDTDSDGTVYFIAEKIPATGYAAFGIAEEPGASKTTIQRRPGNAIENELLRVAVSDSGAIEAVTDRTTGLELVPQTGVRLNQLLRESQGKVSSCAPDKASDVVAETGKIVARLTTGRPESCLPETSYVLYRGLDRLELRNELNTAKLPFDDITRGQAQYFFAFPFQLDAKDLEIRPEAQYGFLQLPQDYLPGARNDSVSSQHVIALTNPGRAVLIAHRQAFRFVFPGKALLPASRSHAPSALVGNWPLPEAIVYSKVLAHTDQGEMRFTGVTNFTTVEPGLGSWKVFDYAIRATGAFDSVAGFRFGEEFNKPVQVFDATFGEVATQSFFSTDQPGVRVVAVKAAERSPAEVVVTSPPPPATPSKRFVIRLQEITGQPARNVHVRLPVAVKGAEIVNLTEMRVLKTNLPVEPLTVELQPFQTLTVRIQIQ
jgi:hypothetical protein